MAEPRQIERYRTDREWLDAEEAELLEAWDALVDRVEQAEAEGRRRDQAWLDAEKFDRQFGLNLPGDSALAVLLGSSEERLATQSGQEAA